MSAGSLQSWSNPTPQMWFHLNDWRLKRLDPYSVISLQSDLHASDNKVVKGRSWKLIFFSEIWMQCFLSSLCRCTKVSEINLSLLNCFDNGGFNLSTLVAATYAGPSANGREKAKINTFARISCACLTLLTGETMGPETLLVSRRENASPY